MAEEKKQLVKRSAMERMANRLQVSREVLEKTLKATVCKGTKTKDGKGYIPMTNEEFVAFIAVANNYKLNPLTKEIYAYPDPKSAGIIPIVSTDGWNKLMTTHPKYKSHSYIQSEKMVKTGNSKLCPEWMEIHIVKTDDSVTPIREHLDECYNGGKKYKDGNYISSPWDSHTKRMLRHKTKIQGAREAFGFGGIYDQDEGERIIEAHLVEDPQLTGKPEVEQPRALSDGTEQHSTSEVKPEPEKKEEPKKKETSRLQAKGESKSEEKPAKKKSGAPDIKSEEDMTEKKPDSAFAEMIKDFKNIKEVVGDKVYYNILGANGHEHANQIKTIKSGTEIMQEMLQAKKDNVEERIPGMEG